MKRKQFENLDFVEKYLIYNKKRRYYTRICSYEGDAWTDSDDFDAISFYCKLNDEFIEKYFDKLNVSCLVHKQKLSETTILNHFYSFYNYFDDLVKYQNLSEEFLIKLKTTGANYNLAK